MRQSVQFKNQEGVTKTGTVKTGLSEIRTGFKNSSREYSFQEPVNETPNLQTPAAVRNSSHDILIPPIGARENEGIMKSIAGENHLRMPSMDVERTQTQMQVCTSRKRKGKSGGAQQRCYRCGKSRMEEHHATRSPANSPEFCSVPKEQRYHVKWVVPDGWNVGDALQKSDIRKSFMRDWKRIRKENNIPSDDRYPGW
jgi:hypothetical protein